MEVHVTKTNKKIGKYLIADNSGSAFINVYEAHADLLKEGDVCYINGAYASLFKDQLMIHEGNENNLLKRLGKNGIFKVVDEFYLNFRLEP